MPANPLVRYIVQWGNTPLCEEKVSIGYAMTSYLLNCKELHCLQYSTNAAFSSILKAPWPDINTNRKWNYCISSTCSGHIQSYSLIRWRHWHSLLNHRTLLIRAKIAQQQQQQQVKPSKQWNEKKNSVKQDLALGAVLLVPIEKEDHSKVCLKRLPCVATECIRHVLGPERCQAWTQQNTSFDDLEGRSATELEVLRVVLPIQCLVVRDMCTAIAQELVTIKDASAERQANCATVGTTPKTVNVSTSQHSTWYSVFNNACVLICLSYSNESLLTCLHNSTNITK